MRNLRLLIQKIKKAKQKKERDKCMTDEEFVRKNYCKTICLCPSSVCESKNYSCDTAQAMLDAAKWREKNPDGLVGTLKGYFHTNYCINCGNNCLFFDLPSNCTLCNAIMKIIKWKDEERQKATTNETQTQ